MNVTRLIDLLPYQLAEHPQDVCLSSKVNGQWKSYSTREVCDMADRVSRAMIKFGIQADDKIALISNNRPEWNFVDMGMLNVGAVNVPIYPTISAEEYKFIFSDAEIKLAFVSDANLYERVKALKDQIPSLQEIYSFDEIPGVKHFSEFLALDNTPDDMAEVEARRKSIEPGSLATMIYTSGTTGTPKGVMLSHHNLVSNVVSTCGVLPLKPEHHVLSFLPLCHIFERTVIYSYYYKGVSVYYAESLETIADNLKELKPHFFTSVPRLLEKVYEKIVAQGSALTGIKKTLFFWALELGHEFDEQGNNGAWYNFQLGIARKLIFSKWQEALGGNLIGIVTGAAALQLRLAKVFCAAGIRIRQGYGQTETSPVLTIDRFEDGEYYLGTVGQAIPGVELRIADNGEIQAKGPNIMMGYYKRPDLTAETVEDGWIHTGDKGEIIDGKYLKITGRVKELFKTSGGKYVSPQNVENILKESKYIEQIMVLGENQKFVSALIIPSFENLRPWCKEQGIDTASDEGIVKNDAVLKLIREEIEERNPRINKVEQVKKFKLLADDWTPESGIMTPTMKVKRRVVFEKYAGLIEDIYKN